MGDIVNAVADVFGFGPASKQAEATTEAAGISAQASREALDLQRRMFEESNALQRRMYEEGIARQQPFYQAGVNALAQMQGRASGIPEFTGQVALGQDPGYAFRLAEGQKALERSAAARGGLLSGATGKALTRYGQEMGSQEYQNAYNRALTKYNADVQREATGYNRLASMAGIGQTTAQQLGAAGQQYAGASGVAGRQYAGAANELGMTNAANLGNLALGMGNIRASQYGTMGSALNQALNTDWRNALSRGQAAFSQTPMGSSGFGTGAAYGNEDIGQYL